MAATHKLIETKTIGAGGASSLEFSSIPQTYTDLILYMSVRGTSTLDTSSVAINLSINGVTTSREHRRLYGVGSSAGADSPSAARLGAAITTSTATTSVFGCTTVYFANYAGSTYKAFSVDNAAENNSTSLNELDLTTGLWSSTAAITTLTFTCTDGNFAQYSSFSLYGIKNS